MSEAMARVIYESLMHEARALSNHLEAHGKFDPESLFGRFLGILGAEVHKRIMQSPEVVAMQGLYDEMDLERYAAKRLLRSIANRPAYMTGNDEYGLTITKEQWQDLQSYKHERLEPSDSSPQQ